MSIASEITRINTNIANSYTAVDNKNGTLPQVQNSANLASAIDSIEVIESATAEGESLSLANTKAMPYSDYVVKGKSEQATRSGKNKFNYASASDTNNTFLSTYRLFEISGLKANSVYNINNMSFNSSLSGKYCYIWKNSEYPGGISYILANPNEYYNQKVFDTNEEGKVYLAMYPNDTTTWNTIISYLQYAQIEEDRKPTSYEPYGVSPSPDYPSEIHSVADDVNILNYGTKEFTSFYQEYGLNIPAGTYTFSAKVTSNDTTYNISRVYFYDANGTSLGFVNLSRDERASETITLSGTAVRVALYSSIDYSSSNGKTATYEDIKLQKGTTSTPYSPYNQGTVTIKQRGTTESNDYTIQTEPLRSLPNGVKDTIEADGIHRRVGRVVLDGTEYWTEGGIQYTGLYSAYVNKDDMKKQEGDSGDLLSNYFKENDFLTQEEGVTKSSNPTTFALILIRLSNDKATNMTTFKNWLSNNPTEVLYQLEEEIIEPLTQNQAATMLDIIKTGSYEGTTNIYTDEDVKPTIGAGYYKKG